MENLYWWPCVDSNRKNKHRETKAMQFKLDTVAYCSLGAWHAHSPWLTEDEPVWGGTEASQIPAEMLSIKASEGEDYLSKYLIEI